MEAVCRMGGMSVLSWAGTGGAGGGAAGCCCCLEEGLEEADDAWPLRLDTLLVEEGLRVLWW